MNKNNKPFAQSHSTKLCKASKNMTEKKNRKSDIFKVYSGDHIPDIGWPTVIITADTIIKSVICAEYFILIDGENKQFHYRQIHSECSRAPEIVANDILKALPQDILNKATYFLSHHQKIEASIAFRYAYTLNEVGERHLIKLFLKDTFRDEFRKIEQATNSKHLKSYLREYLSIP